MAYGSTTTNGQYLKGQKISYWKQVYRKAKYRKLPYRPLSTKYQKRILQRIRSYINGEF